MKNAFYFAFGNILKQPFNAGQLLTEDFQVAVLIEPYISLQS